MKNEFVVFKPNSKKPILVNETINRKLLKRCQDLWYHTKDKKYAKKSGLSGKLASWLGNDKQKAEYLFIHIPKTGGISFKFNVLYNPSFEKEVMIYHKFNFPPKNKAELNIFKEDLKMFTLLRDPVRTVISSYYYFKHIQKTDLISFSQQARNMQLKFLLGYDILASYEPTADDLAQVINLIEDKKLVVGVQGTSRMLAVYDLLGISSKEVDNYIFNKRAGLKYKLADISESDKKQIRELNQLDEQLFQHVMKR